MRRIAIVLALALALVACEHQPIPTAPSVSEVAFTRASITCLLHGSGSPSDTRIDYSPRPGKTILRVRKLSTTCPDERVWYEAYAFIDTTNSATSNDSYDPRVDTPWDWARPYRLGADHRPGHVGDLDGPGEWNQWTMEIEFPSLSDAFPQLEPSNYAYYLIVAHGPGGEIGEIVCSTFSDPNDGHGGPRGWDHSPLPAPPRPGQPSGAPKAAVDDAPEIR